MAVFQKMSKIKTEQQQKQRQKLGGAVNNNDEPRASKAAERVGGAHSREVSAANGIGKIY